MKQRLSAIAIVCSALLCGGRGVAVAATLEEAVTLARGGAVELALHVMDTEQPAYAADPETWTAWETERIYLYEMRHDWAVLADRLAELPADVSPAFRQLALTRRAAALLELGRSTEARAQLRELVWGRNTGPELQRWRRMLIRTYLADNNLADAQIAIQRYQQDYPDKSGEWQRLQARLYLRVMRPEDALAVLAGDKTAEGRSLALLAALWSGAQSPAKVLERAVSLAVAKQTATVDQRLAWAVAAEAALMLGNLPARISALERALVLPAGTPASEQVLEITPDALWETYLKLGQDLGNESRLVVGDDQAWFLAASNRYDAQPIHARALFAVVAFNALQQEQRSVAHWQFGSLLNTEAQGGELLYQLYLQSERFDEPDAVPEPVRYLLVDHVLTVPDIPLASRLMTGLDAPPPDTDPVAWQLRRARVLLLGGQYRGGVAALELLVAGEKQPPVDKLLQVLFDLQTLGLHAEALRFFNFLLNGELPAQQRREILFWAADSSKALARYEQAARLYLRSAALNDPFAMDPWAQTARYQAAQSLARAGLVTDARHLYTGLLNATRDPARQAVLRHEMQQLMLQGARDSAEQAAESP